jgi:hypothetical protein
MSTDLNQDELNELANLLVISQKAKAREALCIKIGISYYKDLGFIYEASDVSFAINLIHHLNEVGNTKAICKLCCKELVPIFKDGRRESILREIVVKLNCNNEPGDDDQTSRIGGQPTDPTPISLDKSWVIRIGNINKKLLTGGTIILIILAGYPAYEYLKQPPQLKEYRRLIQQATLLSNTEGDIGKHTRGGTLVKRITNVDLDNFIVECQFDNPYDSTLAGDWLYGFSFRENISDDFNDPNRKGFDIVISSEKEWIFKPKGISNNNDYSSKLSNLNLSDKSSNKLSLIVKDKKAIFFVNDMYIQTLDVSDINHKGDVFLIAQGGISGNAILYQYKKLKVWSLDN